MELKFTGRNFVEQISPFAIDAGIKIELSY